MTVDSSDKSGLWNEGPIEGAREAERDCERIAVALLDACRDEGRWEAGVDKAMGYPWVELTESTRLCVNDGLG